MKECEARYNKEMNSGQVNQDGSLEEEPKVQGWAGVQKDEAGFRKSTAGRVPA